MFVHALTSMAVLFVADYKELAKPLKAPPHGLEWRRLQDGSWELRSARKLLSLAEQEIEDKKEEEEEGRKTEEGGEL